MRLLQGECARLLPTLGTGSVHAVVTDPPYGIGFLGSRWDAKPPDPVWASECLRVLKPGGHLVAFGGTRTFHHLAGLIEQVGFEIRDVLCWIYATGFPKSRRVGGAFTGFGTGLKPACELILLARRPCEGSVERNLERHGTGALHIEACRIPFTSEADKRVSIEKNDHDRYDEEHRRNRVYDQDRRRRTSWAPSGRFPSNVLLEPVPGVEGPMEGVVLEHRTGMHRGALPERRGPSGDFSRHGGLHGHARPGRIEYIEPTGGGILGPTSRFFVVPKASRKERDAGLGGAENRHPTVKPVGLMRHLVRLVAGKPGNVVLDPFMGSGTTGVACLHEGFDFIGIEREPEYVALAEQRIAHATAGLGAADAAPGGSP